MAHGNVRQPGEWIGKHTGQVITAADYVPADKRESKLQLTCASWQQPSYQIPLAQTLIAESSVAPRPFDAL